MTNDSFKATQNSGKEIQGFPWQSHDEDCASKTGNAGWIPAQGTKSPYGEKKKKNKQTKKTERKKANLVFGQSTSSLDAFLDMRAKLVPAQFSGATPHLQVGLD